jgi:hypothetical protein
VKPHQSNRSHEGAGIDIRCPGQNNPVRLTAAIRA